MGRRRRWWGAAATAVVVGSLSGQAAASSVTSSIFAGYQLTGVHFTSVQGTLVVPRLECAGVTSPTGFKTGMWIYGQKLQGSLGYAEYSGAVVTMTCSDGKGTYVASITVDNAEFKKTLTVKAGQRIGIAVEMSSNGSSAELTKPGGSLNLAYQGYPDYESSSVQVGTQPWAPATGVFSPPVPPFTGDQLNQVMVDGTPIGDHHPARSVLTDGSTVNIEPTELVGHQSFTLDFKNS
jgi:hypothetical protein